MVLFSAPKIFPIFIHIFDPAAVKLQTQQFAGLVRQTAGDGDILKLVVAQCGIATPKRIDLVSHQLSLLQFFALAG